jgi:hypothetical protein
MTTEDIDPNQWPEPQKAVLRMVARDGGWHTSWDDAPTGNARVAVTRKTGVHFQREHNRHESPFYYPMTEQGSRTLMALAALLDPLTT